MVERVRGEREPETLDRVRQDDRRPVALALGLREGLEDQHEIVAPRVRDQRRQLVVADRAEQPVERGVGAPVGAGDERLADRPRRLPEKPQVLGVRHRVEPALEPLAAGRGEPRAEPPPPAQLGDAPAARREHPAELARPRVGHDPVERLTVHVHDPEDPAEPRHRLLGERLPDVALVELGVADHDDDAPRRPRPEVIDEVLRAERAEGRLHGAEPHRARGELDELRVLPPARIGLEAAELAQPGERLHRQAPPQVLEGVEGGRRVGLHRDEVVGPERLPVERGEKAHDRRRRGLVTADLGRVGARAARVGVVDHEGAEPQHLPLDALEDRQFVRHGRAILAWPQARR